MDHQTNHEKHTKLARPEAGFFCRQEWAVHGLPCEQIKELVARLVGKLSDQYRIAYADADHSKDTAQSSFRSSGGSMEYTDKISFHRLDFKSQPGPFQYRPLFRSEDLVLVNGNHFRAKRQILALDPRKFDSLSRKLDRLTQVDLFLTLEPGEGIPVFLQDHLPHWAEIPQLPLSDTEGIAAFLRAQITIPPVCGLVLAGGRSVRMGTDKGLINYHGKPQREYVYDLLEGLGIPGYISCREEQRSGIPDTYRTLADTFLGLGPFGAILSAFRAFPDHAWLVVACDLPLIDRETLTTLLRGRDPSAMATAFRNPLSDFPEPLITLWEPRSYSEMLQFLAQGYSCPRKVLINSTVCLLEAVRPEVLENVNDPVEYERLRRIIAAPPHSSPSGK